MTATSYRVRRATIEDLPNLTRLWEAMKFPVAQLEKRLTEFQVAESDEGVFLGALGMEITARQGRLHHEAFDDFSVADRVRPLFWERIQTLATNHGVFRLWTREPAPFWTRSGFLPPNAELLKKFPEAWGKPDGWLTLQLKDEAAIEALSMDKEFAMFMESQRQETERLLQRARTIKWLATFIALVLAMFVGIALFYLWRQNPALFGR